MNMDAARRAARVARVVLLPARWGLLSQETT